MIFLSRRRFAIRELKLILFARLQLKTILCARFKTILFARLKQKATNIIILQF